MDPLQGSEAIRQLIQLLEENNRKGQAADLSQVMWYLNGMTRQIDALSLELQAVRQQMDREKEPSVKYVMHSAAANLEHRLEKLRSTLDDLWEKIAGCAATAVENFKTAGVSALDKAVSAIGAKKHLESVQEQISGMMDLNKWHMEKAERLGHNLRSAGGHLKNVGRALTGKAARTVDGGREGRLQSAVLAPLRTANKLLSHMNNATLAAIGNVERLEQAAETAKQRKPSIRQALAERQAEAAAQPAPVLDREKKSQEAAL